MQVGEFFFILILNSIIIGTLYLIQKKSLEKHIKRLKNEVQNLEDLVAAIIEEFEEIAEINESEALSAENDTDATSSPALSVATNAYQVEPDDGKNDLILTNDSNHSNRLNDFDKVFLEEINEINHFSEVQLEMDLPMEPTTKDIVEHPKISEGQINLRTANDPKHQRVLDLWSQGISIEEIARELGTGRGEIRLILGIYKRS